MYCGQSGYFLNKPHRFIGVTRLIFLIYIYIHGSVHRESNLIIVQQDATYSVYYIFVHVSGVDAHHQELVQL